jgi:hypothetical protein
MKKTYIKIFLFIVLFIATERFCRLQTGGFRPHKALSDLSARAEWELAPLAPAECARIQTLLDQKFSFLGRGGQFYAFLGEDGESVLKIFKHHRMRINSPLNRFRLPGVLDKYRCKLLGSNDLPEKRLEECFMSCKIAYEEFQEETGILYLRLNKGRQFNKSITLFDKLGIAHLFQLDDLEFVLQKRADLVYPKLQHLIEQGEREAAKRHLDALIALIHHRCSKGIADRDAVIERNFGFIGEKAVVIDVGCFKKDEALKSTTTAHQALLKETASLHHWLTKHDEELATYFDSSLRSANAAEDNAAKRG